MKSETTGYDVAQKLHAFQYIKSKRWLQNILIKYCKQLRTNEPVPCISYKAACTPSEEYITKTLLF